MRPLTAEEQLEEDFNLAVMLLERQTGTLEDIAQCDIYQSVVAMGEYALPLIRDGYVKDERLRQGVWRSLITAITGVKLTFDDIPQRTPPEIVRKVCQLNIGAEDKEVDVDKVRTQRDIRIGYVSHIDQVLGDETVTTYMAQGLL